MMLRAGGRFARVEPRRRMAAFVRGLLAPLPRVNCQTIEGSGPHWLLVRRRISDGEYAFYRAHAPGPVPLAQLVRVTGSRWKVEDGFAAGKELAALDEHQVRCWTSCLRPGTWAVQ